MKVYINVQFIEEELCRRNRSKGWLAYRVGVSESYLSQWLAGSKTPSPKNRKRIMNSLRGSTVTWDALFILSSRCTGASYGS